MPIKMSEIRQKFPMYDHVDDDQLLIALHKKFYSDIPSGEFYQAIDRDTQREKLQKEMFESMGPGEKVLANLGAGFHTVGQGIGQLTGIGGRVTDDQIREKRARDAALAANTRGGGALQIAGEAAGAAPIGLAGMAAAAPLGLGALATAAIGGGIGGAASGALSPVTEDESRGFNAAVGGTLGTVLPFATKAAKGLYGYARNALPTKGALQRRAVEELKDMIPAGTAQQDLNATAQRLRQAQMPGQPPAQGQGTPFAQAGHEVPTSAAQASGDPWLAQAEAVSRAHPSTQPQWAQFDMARQAALAKRVQGLAPDDAALDAMYASRTAATQPMREGALQAAGQVPDFHMPVANAAQQLLAGPTAANPAVRTITEYVLREATENPSPARLYEIRKVLASKLKGPAVFGDQLSAAAKSAGTETQALMASIDDALEQSSGGLWKPYLAKYAEGSKPIESAKVLRQTAEAMADKPTVTGHAFNKTIKKLNEGKYGQRLTPQDEASVSELSRILEQGEAPGRIRKLAGTMGGGSQTTMDMLASGFKPAELVPFLGRLHQAAQPKVDMLKAQLMQDPEKLAEILLQVPPTMREKFLQGLGLAASDIARMAPTAAVTQ